MNETLKIIFADESDYRDATYQFKYESDFDINTQDDEMSITLNVNDARDAMYDIDEILNSSGITRYHFDESMMESKKAKVKKLIERIVERVIAKKVTEAKDNSITSPTAKAYFMYLKSLDKANLLRMAKSNHRIDSMDKGTPKMDLVYDILAAEYGNKWFERTIRLPEYAKKYLKESIKLKRRLKESTELDADLYNLDQYIQDKLWSGEIQKNMEIYGWEVDDIQDIKNYYDVAHLIDVDSRLIKDSDLDYITRLVYDMLNDMNDEDR